jgi:hypothetical protein
VKVFRNCGQQGSAASGTSGKRMDTMREAMSRALSNASNLPPKTILFVDDETTILKLRRRLFEHIGYSVFTAGSGDACRIRRTHGDIPIIMSSGCASLPERLLDIVDASVDKGVGPEALIEALDSTFAARSATWTM